MRDVREQLPPLPFRGLEPVASLRQPFRHLIETFGEASDLVAAAVLNPHRQVSFRDPRGE